MVDAVSVIITTYNRFEACCRAVRAAVNQTRPPLEVIVVDDASTDTRYAAHDWGSSGSTHVTVRYLRLPVNSRSIYGFPNPNHCRNAGYRAARGDWIALCDDDDEWLPHKLQRQMEAAAHADMVVSDCLLGYGAYREGQPYPLYNGEHYAKTLRRIFTWRASRKKLQADGSLPRSFTYSFLRVHNCIITSTVLIHKPLLDAAGGFDLTTKPPGEDYSTWLKLLQQRSSRFPNAPAICTYLHEPLAYYDNGHAGGSTWRSNNTAKLRAVAIIIAVIAALLLLLAVGLVTWSLAAPVASPSPLLLQPSSNI